MIEELKIIVELLDGATDKALWAFVLLGCYNLLKLLIIVFPSYLTFRLLITRMWSNVGQAKNADDAKSS